MTEKEIWNWFSKNNPKLIDLIESGTSDYSTYNQFTEMLQDYNENIFPELTGHESGRYVLIITCDGHRDGIPFVERLFDSAPKFDNWLIEKFRKPGQTVELNFEGLELKPKDIKIKYAQRNNFYDIDVLIANYNPDDDRYKSLAFLYLDHFIGEYNVMTKIGRIDFEDLHHDKQAVSLIEFQQMLTLN